MTEAKFELASDLMTDSWQIKSLSDTLVFRNHLPWHDLALPLAAAEDAIARLDERLAKSAIRDGWIERAHFADTIASLWCDGTRVDLEDLVLHDADMDIRTPTHELTRAHHHLRLRRRIMMHAPDWALSDIGLDVLRGRGEPFSNGLSTSTLKEVSETLDGADALAENEDPKLRQALDQLHAAMARADRHLSAQRDTSDGLIYDDDWDEAARLAQWRTEIADTAQLPPTLAVALALQAWQTIEPLQHMPWLGRLLAAALLRARGKTKAHLFCLNVGLRAIHFERRRTRDPSERLVVVLEAMKLGAEAGLADHDRWLNARAGLERKIAKHRTHSHLAGLVDLIMRRPIVSARMIAHELKITPRAAQNLVAALDLREATGRTHYRAWGVL